MVPKCGKQKVWHWAHRAVRNCEDWWEPETVWHRDWKDEFPVDWQEVIRLADDGERHIADVRTPLGLVLEFQRSQLPSGERASREAFYRNMVWVVDGTRLPKDVDRFFAWKQCLYSTRLDGIFETMFPHHCFPANWLNSSALVVFDFNGTNQENAPISQDGDLWCLFPGRVAERALVAPLPRREFVRMAREQSFIFEFEGIAKLIAQQYQKDKALWFGRPPRSLSHFGDS